MQNKYLAIGRDYMDWKNIKIKRNLDKEQKLFKVLGITPDDTYHLINRNFHSNNSIRKTDKQHKVQNIHIPNNQKQIELNIIEGFSVFDWIGVLENAKSIHTVHTSIHYLMDLYCNNPNQEKHIYHRNGEDLNKIKSLFTNEYIYHD
jgi:hypothetical protein